MTKNKKVKREVQHRGASKWNLYVKKIREENPGKKQSEIFKIAKLSYVK